MSVPAETPDEVKYFPSSTHRAYESQVTLVLCSVARLKNNLLEVARRPSSTRALARIADPEHTDITTSAEVDCRRRNSSIAALPSCSMVPMPPGRRMRSSAGASPKLKPVTVLGPCTERIGPAFSARSKFLSHARSNQTSRAGRSNREARNQDENRTERAWRRIGHNDIPWLLGGRRSQDNWMAAATKAQIEACRHARWMTVGVILDEAAPPINCSKGNSMVLRNRWYVAG